MWASESLEGSKIIFQKKRKHIKSKEIHRYDPEFQFSNHTKLQMKSLFVLFVSTVSTASFCPNQGH